MLYSACVVERDDPLTLRSKEQGTQKLFIGTAKITFGKMEPDFWTRSNLPSTVSEHRGQRTVGNPLGTESRGTENCSQEVRADNGELPKVGDEERGSAGGAKHRRNAKTAPGQVGKSA